MEMGVRKYEESKIPLVGAGSVKHPVEVVVSGIANSHANVSILKSEW